LFVDGREVLVDADGVEIAFDGDDAGHAPAGILHLLNDFFVFWRGRVEAVAEVLAEGGEIRCVFVRENDDGGIAAMLQAVIFDAFFACDGDRAGRELRVGLVGCELLG
jgi:hypothetical protein